MRVCAACGLIAPKASKACEGCQAALDADGAVREAEGASGGAAWVSARCSFDCRVCGRRAPLDHLDLGELLFCALCGTEQAFVPKAWRGLLDAAHDIGDLGWPKPEGRNPHAELSIERHNEYRDVGLRRASRAWDQQSSETSNPLHATLGPGHPLCRACHAPLDASWAGDTARVACAACHEEVLYTVPAGKAHEGLVAVVAEDHRKDHLPARLEHDAATAAVAVACPSCGASLSPDAKSPLLTCAFCKTVSRVPARAFYGLTGAAPRVEPFWLLFAGPSPARREILGTLERKARRKAQVAAERDASGERDAHRDRGGGRARDVSPISRNKRLTALWFVVCLVSAGMLVPTLLAYDSRFGLPGFGAWGSLLGCVVFWGVPVSPSLFFGMPVKKKEEWQTTDGASARWGIATMALLFVVSMSVTAVLAPTLLHAPPAKPGTTIRR
jgi:hypothetical protein